MKNKILTLLTLVLTLFSFAGGKPAKTQSQPWVIDNGVPVYKTADGLGYYFNFSTNLSQPIVNYFTTKLNVPQVISGSLTTTFTIDASPDCVFDFNHNGNNGTAPPALRLLIWGHRDSLNSGWRWWSNPIHYVLVGGNATVTVPIDPSQWSGVNGEHADRDAGTIAAFNNCIHNVSSLGMTFDGGDFFGHGAYCRVGSATFTIWFYGVQP